MHHHTELGQYQQAGIVNTTRAAILAVNNTTAIRIVHSLLVHSFHAKLTINICNSSGLEIIPAVFRLVPGGTDWSKIDPSSHIQMAHFFPLPWIQPRGCYSPHCHTGDNPYRHRVKCDLFDANWQSLYIFLLSQNSCIFEFSKSKRTNFHPPFFRHQNNMLEIYAWPVVGGSCLLTKRGSKQHRHRPKRTKISNISLVQHANLGVPNSPFQGLSEHNPYTPPHRTHSGHT